jgi:hypothetical protein
MRQHMGARHAGLASVAAAILILGLAASPASAGPSEITATLGSCTYEFVGSTVPCEPLATLQGQYVTLGMGSDTGVVCAEMHLPDLGVGSFSGWTVAVVVGQPEYQSPRLINLGSGGAGGAVQTCTGGIDQLVLNDLFTNPGRYWAIVAMVEANPIGPPCPLACVNLMGQFAVVGTGESPGGPGPSGGGQLPDAATSPRPAPLPWAALGMLMLVGVSGVALQRGRRPR